MQSICGAYKCQEMSTVDLRCESKSTAHFGGLSTMAVAPV